MKTRVIQNEPEEPAKENSAGAAREPRRPMNVAARMARWSAHHRKKAILGWLVFAVVLFAISFLFPMKKIVSGTSGPGESGRTDTIPYDDFAQPAGESVLVESRSLTADAPEFRSVVRSLIDRVSTLDAVAKVESPYDADNRGQISTDKHSVLVPIEIRGPASKAVDKVDAIVARVAAVQEAHPAFYVGVLRRGHQEGNPGRVPTRSKKAGLYSIPLTLAILLLAFGALVAAGPLLLGLTAVLATFGLVALHQPGAPIGRISPRDHPPDRAR